MQSDSGGDDDHDRAYHHAAGPDGRGPSRAGCYVCRSGSGRMSAMSLDPKPQLEGEPANPHTSALSLCPEELSWL